MNYNNGTIDATTDPATATIVELVDRFQDEPTRPPKPKKGVSPAEHGLDEPTPSGEGFVRLLETVRVDGTAIVKAPPSVFTFDGEALCTMHSMSVVSGQAKSKKSMFSALLAALTINPHTTRVDSRRLSATRAGDVLLFDTEQSSYYATAMAKRIRYLADRENRASGEDGLHMYRLQEMPPHERMHIVRGAIEHHRDTCRLVIIDGIRDLVMSINDETEATMMNTLLLNTVARYNIHIVVVLHENKSSGTLRGHIGTELQNKAENVFTVTSGTGEDKQYSVVETTMYRGAGMDRLGLKGTGQVQAADGSQLWVPEFTDDRRALAIGKGGGSSSAKPTVASLTAEQHTEVAAAIWASNPSEVPVWARPSAMPGPGSLPSTGNVSCD